MHVTTYSHVRRTTLLALMTGVAVPLTAQQTPAERGMRTPPRPATAAASVPFAPASFDTSAFAGLKYREIGPYRGGRSVAVAGSASRPLEYWMGTTGGGVFKTTDAGLTWQPVTDKYFGGTIGAIGVAESNPDIVYVGTGEYPIRGNNSHGDGVFKTTDGGKTWTFLGLKETQQISRVKVHPTNPDIAWIGAQGKVFAPNAERGVYQTTDGGKSWRKVLFRNDSTGITDLVLDPTNPNVLYAAFWQVYRTPWKLWSGGPGGGLFKSTDGGETWAEITRNQGLPKGLWGNVGITVSQANPNRLWAIIEADSGGVYRSEDAGRTWTYVNNERKLRQRAWYYTRIFADPKDVNAVWVLNVGLHKSTDGGKTYKTVAVPHGDNHDFWIAPNDPNRIVNGNDGGANVTFNGGKVWTPQDFATAQFYHVTTTNHFPYYICGAQQDNSTLCGPSRWPGGIAMGEWKDAGGGESGYIAAKPNDPNVTFAGSYGGLLTRMDRRTAVERNVTPWPLNPMGHSSQDIQHRFQWTYPIVFSPHDPNKLYATGSNVYVTTNDGESWTMISPPLVRADPKTMGPSGGPITLDQTGVETYATIFTFAESPVRAGVLWTGSDDGVVHVSQDGGRTWNNATPRDIPEFARMSLIEPSPYAAGTAYLAANRYQMDDKQPYLYKTTDYGRSWTRIDSGIDREQFTRVIRADPVRRGLLYAGTERGVWVSFDDGGSWQALQLNLPKVPVHDLAIKEGDLIVATHGRSFYVLDDLSALRQLTPQLAQKPAHLFKPRDVHCIDWGGGFFGAGNAAAGEPAGANPPSGGIVYYHLAKANAEVTLDFLDGAGKLIRSFTSAQDSAAAADSVAKTKVAKTREDSLLAAGLAKDSVAKLLAPKPPEGEVDFEELFIRGPKPPRVANKAGLNSFAWNLRYPDASRFEGMVMWAANVQGPIAPPGTYAVRMTVDGQSQTQQFRVMKDPRTRATPADIQAQFQTLIAIRDKVSEANDAVKTIRNVKWQIEDRTKQAAGKPDVAKAVTEQGSALAQALSAVEGEVYQVRNQSSQDPLNYPIRLNNKIAALLGVVGSSEGRPQRQALVVFDTLSRALGVQLTRMRRALDEDLPKLNQVLRQAGLAEIVPRPVEPPKRADTVAEEAEDVARW
ncbi:MAG TPA: glycosyl hydrolase [Gemmatimonadaceae bacterium]|nr:glycosyl hydrolase [Gemmatimonadaceae bacterium]